MVDLEMLCRAATAGDGAEEVAVTRRMLGQVVAELTAAREAQAREGQVFGLPRDQRI
jgi:hypothetical protein